MNRRTFIAALGGAAAWPVVARAQQPLPVIGYLDPGIGSAEAAASLRKAFRDGLKEAGFIDGKNLEIEYQSAEEHYDRAPAMVAKLVERQVNLIVAVSLPMALATKAATLPIVFMMGDDPVKFGLVASLNRPGANVTGISMLSPAIEAKRMELLHESAPKATRIASLVNPQFPASEVRAAATREAADKLQLQLNVYNVSNEEEIDQAFAAMIERATDALIVTTDPFFFRHKERVVKLAERHALPAAYFSREFVLTGGLMSYGSSIPDAYRQTGIYAGRVLKGEKPADLPILQPTKFDLVINLKAAKALGLDVPHSLLARADEVIE